MSTGLRNWLSVGGLAATLAMMAAVVDAAPADAQRRTTAPRTEATAGQPAAGVVNINTATEAELRRLPGIGETKARAIVALRQRLGRFRRVEEILRVRGIGRATFRRLRTMLTLQGQTTLPPPSGPTPRGQR